jgi:hypothetical protein
MGYWGVKVIEVRKAVDVSVVLPLTEPAVAVITAVPVPVGYTNPVPPASFVMPVMLWLDEVQTGDLRVSVLLFEKVPKATNCCSIFPGIDEFVGETEMDVKPGGVRLDGW